VPALSLPGITRQLSAISHPARLRAQQTLMSAMSCPTGKFAFALPLFTVWSKKTATPTVAGITGA
jgi:hypothetical protein